MNDVIVAAGSIGFSVKFGCWPAATATTIVSPTARDTPSTYAATMPDNAAGTTTVSEVRNRVAPIAYAPSRKCIGTARMASSATELMYGVIMMPMTMPGPSMLKPGRFGRNFCSSGVTNSSAK